MKGRMVEKVRMMKEIEERGRISTWKGDEGRKDGRKDGRKVKGGGERKDGSGRKKERNERRKEG